MHPYQTIKLLLPSPPLPPPPSIEHREIAIMTWENSELIMKIMQ